MPGLHGQACFEAGVSQHVHVVSDITKGRLKVSPMEQAGSLSPQRGREPVVERECLLRDKRWRGQTHTLERQAHLYLLSTVILSHYAVSPVASFGGNIYMCVQAQEWFQGWPDSTLSFSARRLRAELLQRHRFFFLLFQGEIR